MKEKKEKDKKKPASGGAGGKPVRKRAGSRKPREEGYQPRRDLINFIDGDRTRGTVIGKLVIAASSRCASSFGVGAVIAAG